MSKLTIIGDIHGKLEQYKQIIDNCEESICVGDFGFKKEWDWHQTNAWMFGHKPHWINIGNHDWLDVLNECHLEYGHTGNFNYFTDYDIFTVRGADSIDKHLRTEGVDWFANEELNYLEQLEAFDFYCKVKPNIVVSHDCPQSVMQSLFGYPEKSQTRNMLQAMFNEHKPDLWVFGHHHQSKDVNVLGTRFVCLNELETMKLIF
jgi:predicted phosphodiesterase